jgi:hypothetical protein
LGQNAGANVTQFGDGIWLQHGDEILFATATPQMVPITRWVLNVARRGAIGTLRTTFQSGEAVGQVFVAYGTGGRSSFRYQARSAEAPGLFAGVWIGDETCEHPVVGMLCMLTSSALEDGADGLFGGNYTAGFGNFSCLPPGIGAGIPASEIDFQSFHDIWDRTREWRMPGLILDKSQTCRAWIEDNILKVTGLVLIVRNGKLRLEYPSIPAIGSATAALWTHTSGILTQRLEDGVEQSRLKWSLDGELSATTIVFYTKRANGQKHEIKFNDSDFADLTKNVRGFFRQRKPPMEIDAYSLIADSAGNNALASKRAMQFFFWLRRPPPLMTLFTDLSFIDSVQLADYVQLTHYDVPDVRTGKRGVTNLVCWVRRKKADTQKEEIEWTLIGLGAGGKFGRIAPCAVINGAPVANVAIVHANRFTDPLAGTGLATQDCNAFQVNWVVRLRARSGALVATTPATQRIVTITPASNKIELDGNFGGAWVSGHIIELAGYDDQAVDEQTDNVSYADATTEALGAARVDDAFSYGQV